MILLTGGAGFIGSHVAVELINSGYEVLIVDDLSNSRADVCERIRRITGTTPGLVIGNICEKGVLDKIFENNKIDSVIHLAGKKAVGESVAVPLSYYDNNLNATIELLKTMDKYNVNSLVFSSSATVYDSSNPIPYVEGYKTASTNPYGWTKVFSERIIQDYVNVHKDFCAVSLRYFNPIGAHESGLIGEEPSGIPNNLMPYITKVANKQLDILNIYGNDYPTVDGTGVRDYLHVCDLAEGHVAAFIYAAKHTGFIPVNLGCGRGTSVLQMVESFEKANGLSIPYVIKDRRPGDIAEYYACADKAKELFNWETHRDIACMCRDSYNFEKRRLEGFK